MKILILKPSSLGDVVQALPVLRLLKRHWPESKIYWWVDANLAPLLEGDPDLAGVVRFERRRWAAPVRWPEMWRSLLWMRAQVFDLVIDLQCLARSGAFAWLANGQFLVGLDEPREGARGFYDLIVPRASFHTHAVDWYLAVLQHLGVPVHWDFDWLPKRPAVAADVKCKWFDAAGPAPAKPKSSPGTPASTLQLPQWIALLPGARWPNKRWPAEHFAELVSNLASRFERVRFIILGAAEDKSLADVISGAAPGSCLDLTGQTSLPEMVECLRLCHLVVTNDTGPMHVAVALRKPVVALFGPTEPRRTGPYGQAQNVLQLALPCVPCLKPYCTYSQPLECLRAITPAEVSECACRQLASVALGSR